ncbi:uncharacterized protein LOC121786644 [Salvia splendens]|uniref:uncharacterized protein LOC121786644 n=1 Tax=Salvia splendens TaxID=180675 RepID=UPI001C25564A|nr:uncharacterized protein LOC121786644 [Salvia splendens]
MKRPKKQPSVVDFIKQNKVDVIGLLETKMDADSMKTFMGKYFRSWQFTHNLSQLTCGRMLLIWNPQTAKVDIVKKKQAIHTRIRCTRTLNEFNYSIVYGLYTDKERHLIWSSVIDFCGQVDPFLISGDFNSSPEERTRGTRRTPNKESKELIATCALLGLQDVTAIGCEFTWTNGRVFSKIDRIMVNEGWHNAGYLSSARFPPPGARTDHSPAIATLFGELRSFPKPFKIFNFWLTHAGFEPLLRDHWRTPIQGCKQFVLMERGKEFKKILKSFNFKEFSNLSQRVKDYTKEMEDLKLEAGRDTGNAEIQDRIRDIRSKVLFYSTSEKAFYGQKSRLKHLCRATGIQLFPFSCQEEQLEEHDHPLQQRRWFSLLKSLNTTAISLIPKTSTNSKVSDFRPIAYCNVVYKVITKIFSKRLEMLLPKIVSPAQSAFITGRSIMDNIYLAEEIMRGYTVKRGPPRCTVKIDLRKAYDTVDWSFLWGVLQGLNFHPFFIHLIMECVISPSYTITVNGSHHGYFRGKRGLRQGDHMSPPLFILCMEYLSRLLLTRTTREFSFHKRCGQTGITHLAFADDLLLFGRGDLISMQILADTMEEFYACSGLGINRGKSNMFIAGTNKVPKETLLQVFGFPEGSLPIKYLGIPLASKRLVSSDYGQLIDKLSDKIKKWPSKTLSFVGRLELITSVVKGVEAYWLQAFPIPWTIIEKLIGIARTFLWGKKYGQVAWDDVCKPKKVGGLGVRNLKAWNSALHAKTLWSIHSKKDSLWIRWIHAEYIRNNSIWDWTVHKKNDSMLIKKLLSIRDEMLDRCTRDEITALWSTWFAGKGVHEAYEWFRPRGRLYTRNHLHFLENLDPTCQLCRWEEEPADHLFFKCPKTWAVWGKIMPWLGIARRLTTIRSVIKWARRQIRGSQIVQMAIRIALMASVAIIWRTWNKVIFDGKA